LSKKDKKVKQRFQVESNKVPRSIIINPNSFYDEVPVWSFKFSDFEHYKWGINANSDLLSEVVLKLKEFERMRWKEILITTSGRKNNTRNHFIPLTSLVAEAQKRFYDLNLSEIFGDQICSLALMGKLRLFGFVDENGVFYLIWIDKEHEVYPVYKKYS